MDNFKVIYKILTTLESSMDYERVDLERISCEALGVSEERRNRLLKMLDDAGYISGVSVRKYADGEVMLMLNNLDITLKGLEYLAENSLMRKAYNAAKGIVDLIP
ncbi:MAG: YjcQ family protein [Peptostreptococcaceae bacterium]|nr:YjcQ family protein [Peptostreptococcaceae bacterium]